MKRIILAVLILGIMATSTFAGTYTITLTTEQEQAIIWAKNRYNASHATDPEFVPLTAPQYFMMRINGFVDNYNEQKAIEERKAIEEAYKNAEQAVKDQIKALLGI